MNSKQQYELEYLTNHLPRIIERYRFTFNRHRAAVLMGVDISEDEKLKELRKALWDIMCQIEKLCGNEKAPYTLLNPYALYK